MAPVDPAAEPVEAGPDAPAGGAGVGTEHVRPANVWVVRAGVDGRYAEHFVANGYVAFGELDIASASNPDEVRRRYEAACPTEGSGHMSEDAVKQPNEATGGDGEKTADVKFQGRPEQFYHVIDTDKVPGFRSGTRTADMRQCIIDNPDGVTSAMLAEASGAPRPHCSDYLWRCMQRGWVDRVGNLYHSKITVSQYVNFRFGIRKDDYVITPERDTERLRYGRITGSCVSAAGDDGCPYRNRRAVNWNAATLERSACPKPLQNTFKYDRSVFRVLQREAFLAAIGQSDATRFQGHPDQFYHVIDADKVPGVRPGTRTADMRQCIIDNPDGVTSAMLAEASGAPRSHCSNYLWRCMQRGWVDHRPEPEPAAGARRRSPAVADTEPDRRNAVDTDHGVEEEREDPERGAVEHPFDPAKIKVRTVPALVGQLLSRMEHDEIDLAPDFQRMSGIWNAEKKSRLIESLLLRIPIPVFYVAADADDKWAVVDGVQRLSTIRDYVTGKFPLTRLEYRSEFDGRRHDDLPRPMQRRIDETQFVVNVIEPGTPPEVTFNIFSRINTGGMPLKGQEIRHALNPGPVRHYLKKLAESIEFTEATDRSISPNRMDDRTCVLRFLAFHMAPWEEYSGSSLDGHLDAAMKEINAMGRNRRDALAQDFRKAMRAAARIFGDDAFRKRYVRSDSRRQVSMPLFEAWSVQLARCPRKRIDRLVERRDEVRERFMALLNQDPEFEKAISSSTGTPRRIRKRFAAIRDLVQEFF